MIVKLLTEHHLEFLSLKGGYTGSSESTLIKMSNCWKSHAAAHIYLYICTKITFYGFIDTAALTFFQNYLMIYLPK